MLSLLQLRQQHGLLITAVRRGKAVTSRKDIKTGTPQETIAAFTYAAAVGHVDTAMQHVLPDGTDYEDIREVLTASPSDDGECQFRLLFEAVDTSVPVKITSKQEKQNGLLTAYN